ncbi:MAG: 4'-phosphopantetheinyl transferase superfamily protein [Phycisphaeraceae bacterium]|nr:MAG: 4'-phosphopantetheinyl transferase superfamily protein [Phycisphaeraceae bacterium]
MTATLAGVSEIECPCGPTGLRIFLGDMRLLPEPQSLLPDIDEAERLRATAFRSPDARESFIRRRWLRRVLIAREHDLNPADIRIDSDRLGRPRVMGPDQISSLVISTSSAGQLALIAWCRDLPLGVDLARLDPDQASPAAAAVFMSPDELRKWQDGDTLGFFRLWSRKEAALKAIGTGFATDPPTVSVIGPTLITHAAPLPLAIELHDLPAPSGYVGAVALGQNQSR